MPSFGPSTGSEILCMGQKSLYTATIINPVQYVQFGSVLPRVLSCLGELWHFKNLTLSSDTPTVRAMLLLTGYLGPCEVAQVVMFV